MLPSWLSCWWTLSSLLKKFIPFCRYISVGDIAYIGDYPDSETVVAYRYDEEKFEKPLGFDLVRTSFTR